MSLASTSSLKKTSASGTTDSPYLGSKISLVSKAKIRYEGILYTIDANESTVALSKVRSFGTEDRPTDRPVPARDEIFEYIIFRGADIEDLQVREPPQSTLTQDPAIVESSAYPDNSRSNTIGTNTSLTGLTQQNGPTRTLSNRGTMPSPPAQPATGKGLKSSDPLRQLNYNQHRSSRSYNQQSPLMQYEGQDYGYGNTRRHRPSHDYYPMNRRLPPHFGYAEWPRPSQRYSRPMPIYENSRFYAPRRQTNGNNFYGSQRQRRHSTGALNSNNQSSSRKTDRTQSTRSNTNARSTLKFVGDFDFEKSNAEFDKNAIEDEIKKSLSLKTIKTEPSCETTTSTEQDKDKESEKEKELETEKEKENHVLSSETMTPPADGYYDKQKSFFDRISCEANEKEKTKKRRNWNEERRMNAETFGLKYRPVQQNNNQRSSSRRNPTRYQRSGNARNTMYYGNFNNRVRAY